MQKLKGKVSKIIDLTEDVKHFEIELEENFNFIAGQFVNISIEEKGETIRKPYSIASNPNGTNKIELCIKLIPDGNFTPILWKKDIGYEVEIMGPLGLFNNENVQKDKLVFVGTGTGIGPLRSMIFDELKKQSNKEITLIFGVRKETNILYDKEFQELEKTNPNFKYVPVVSKPTDKWEGRVGHVQDNFDVIDPLNSECYLCGLPVMVEESENKLLSMGMDKEQIKHEKYS